MNASKTHQYRGFEIAPTQHAERRNAGYRWYVQTYHSPTGMAYDSQHCPHFVSLAAARESIDERVQQAAATEGSDELDAAAFVG
jgi:hypothetical protein